MRCPRCFRKLLAGATCPADGGTAIAESAATAEPPPRPEIPGWTVGDLIAAGGQASVWRVTRDGDDTAYALKITHATSPEVVAQLADEAAAQRAIGAPAVAAIVAHGVLGDGRPYLVMELIAGGTLGGVLERAPGPLPLDAALGWARGIAYALGALHGAGWIHRDLKPDNAARDAVGRVRLLDLGRASPRGAVASGAVIAGTPLYMAPEQLRGGSIDERADIYALGAVLFEVLATRPPFGGDRATIELGHLSFRPSRVSSLRPVPRALDDLVAVCLAKSPDDRPASATAVHDALVAIDLTDLISSPRSEAQSARSRVALVSVEGAPSSFPLDAEARRRGGIVARQQGGRAILAFVPDEHAAPLPAALSLARVVADAGASAVLHVADVLVRRARGRTTLYGPAVERPTEWATIADATIALTADAARELDDAEVIPVEGAAGFFTLRAAAEPSAPTTTVALPALLGSDALLANALTAARATLADGPPAIWVVLGAPGAGKSRIAGAIVEVVTAEVSDAHVLRVDGQRSFGAGASAAASSLFAQLARVAGASAVAPAPTHQPLTIRVRQAVDAALAAGPLAIVIDDAQWIDDALLDALATTVRTGTGPLWIAIVASDSVAARPTWLDGARVTQTTIAPLDAADAGALLRRLLAPARRIPDPLIARLVARTGGTPGVIAALARELVRAGLVRQHPGSAVWYLAADEIDFLPPAPGIPWFVSRRLAALAPGLAELARACALLGPRFTLADVTAACDEPAAAVTIDPRVGLDSLLAAGLMRVQDEAYVFRSDAEQEAIAQSLAEPTRVAIHRAVLAQLRARDATPAELAYHAARAGEHELALDQLELLATDASARLAHFEAARWLTLALDLAGPAPSPRRRRLLTERGRTRRILSQYDEAAIDLREARALAPHASPELIDILVIETAIADVTEQLGEAVRAIELAASLATPELPDAIFARLHNWRGVVRARQERWSEARADLEHAIELAERTGDHDTSIGSMLMLGSVLCRLGLAAEGRAVLDRVITRCEATGDHLHLAAAHVNRIDVWRRLNERARAEADAERAIAIANQMGIDQLELWGWYNLSELRWWTGDVEGALAAAEHSHRIGVERFRARPPVIGTLWYAFLLACAGDVAAAEQLVDDVRAEEVTHDPWLALVRDATRLACAADVGSAWAPLVERAARPGAEEDAVIVHWARARTARRAGDDATADAARSAASAAAAILGRTAPAP